MDTTIKTTAVEMTLSERLELEQVIEIGKRSFFEVGSALSQIRDRRGYKPEFKTFDEYCQRRWGWTRMGAAYYIDAAKVVSLLPPEIASQLDITHAAELARLSKPSGNGDRRKKELDVEAIKEIAGTIDFTKQTAKQVTVAVNKRKYAEEAKSQQERAASSATYDENPTRPGWDAWGLDAGVGPNVLPLEMMWHTPREMVMSHFESDLFLRKLAEMSSEVKSWKKHDESELSSVPAAVEVRAAMFDEIRDILASAIRQVKQVVEERDVVSKAIAEAATDVPVPGVGPEWHDTFLLTNSKQKRDGQMCPSWVLERNRFWERQDRFYLLSLACGYSWGRDRDCRAGSTGGCT